MRESRGFLMLLGWVVVLGVSTATATEPAESHAQTNAAPRAATAIYDLNPAHLWNRLHRAIYLRVGPNGTEYGEDRLDPLLWSDTKHLRSGPSYQQFVQTLDELIAGGADALPRTPLKRALLQRDLWAAFDWVNNSFGRDPNNDLQSRWTALSVRLTRAIKLLALSEHELRSLPDNYAEAIASKTFASIHDGEHPERPFLPSDLFQTNGNWVGLRTADNTLVAPRHADDFGARSVFLAFLNVPSGRQATLDYLKALREFPQPWKPYDDPNSHERRIRLNPDLPKFPAGTQVALIRQMMLIDDKGAIFLSKLTESVQIRVYREIRAVTDPERHLPQDVYEFQLSYPKLFAGQHGGLRAIEPQEHDFTFVPFMAGFDPFQTEDMTPPLTNAAQRVDYIEGRRAVPVLQTCLSCHGPSGIGSLLSYTRQLSGDHIPPAFVEGAAENSFVSEAMLTKSLKVKRYEWGLLQGLWLAESAKAE